MKNRLPPSVPVAIAFFAAVAAVALWAAARQPGPRDMPRTEPALVTATAEDNQPQPNGSVEQMQYVFHELHTEGCHALCGVCGTRAGVEGAGY